MQDENSVLDLEQTALLEKLDTLYDAMLSNRSRMRLNDRDYDFLKDLEASHHLIVSPDIPKGKINKMIQNLCGCTYPKARRIMLAHQLLWGDARQNNLEFKKIIVCDKFLKFAEEAEKGGDTDKAAEFYEKYYNMMGLGDLEQVKTPRALPKLVVLKNDSKLLEIEDAEIDE